MNGTHEDRFRWYSWIPGSHHRAMDYHSAQVFKQFIDHPLHASLALLPPTEPFNASALNQVTGSEVPLRLPYRHAHDIYGNDKQQKGAHNGLRDQKI